MCKINQIIPIKSKDVKKCHLCLLDLLLIQCVDWYVSSAWNRTVVKYKQKSPRTISGFLRLHKDLNLGPTD